VRPNQLPVMPAQSSAPTTTASLEAAVAEPVISFRTPLPLPLHAALVRFIEDHPQWDQYRLVQAALSGFLLQQGMVERQLTRRYVGSMFGRAA